MLLDGTRALLQKAVRDVHRVVVATLSGCAAGWYERVLVAGLHNVRTHRCVSTYISMCTMSHWSVLCVAIYQAPITRVEPGPHNPRR